MTGLIRIITSVIFIIGETKRNASIKYGIKISNFV